MRKFLFTSVAIILMAIGLVSMAGADIFDMWQGTAYTDSPIVMNAGTTLTVPSITATTFTGTASEVKVGNIIDTSYGLKNSTAGNAQVNLSANMGLDFDTGSRLGALKVVNGDGIDLGTGGVEVDVGDIVGDGLIESTIPPNNLAVNVTGYKGLEIGTGANDSELMIEIDAGLTLGAGGLEVLLSDTSLSAAGVGMSITPGAFQMDIIGGGTAGNFTLTGAANGDEVIGVTYFNASTGNVTAITELTSEFSIPDTNILNQTYGGTASTDGYLQVFWMDRTD